MSVQIKPKRKSKKAEGDANGTTPAKKGSRSKAGKNGADGPVDGGNELKAPLQKVESADDIDNVVDEVITGRKD